jgi:subtilase family serine protease
MKESKTVTTAHSLSLPLRFQRFVPPFPVRVFMTNFSLKSLLKPFTLAACAYIALATLPALSQSSALQPRINAAAIDNSARTTLTGTRPPLARPAFDSGAVPTTMKLQGMAFVFSRTPAQQTELDALVAAQQNPASPLYHQWLTPDQFAARFGAAPADIATVESWLQSQGFSIDSVARSRTQIAFSGNAGLVASAFGAPLHYFKTPAYGNIPAETHFAPATDLTVPSALASSVLTIANLSDFRPHSHLKVRGNLGPVRSGGPQAQFTSSQSGSHFLTPGDIATIYDITPAYSAGFTGANQSIAIVGQTYVPPTDITNFQTAVGITANLPTFVLVPGSGGSAVSSGDEAESDLDLEYSSTIAKGAQVFFVYTGNGGNLNVFNSIQYAVDERISPIISSSYGDCEPDLGLTNYTELNAILEQAATQGQTVISAAGDSGSTDCYGISDTTITTVAEQEQLAVDYPASSQYVTALGGTEFPAADVAAGNNTYFTAQGTTDVISSALSYIPEMVWNDDAAFVAAGSTNPLASGGGGISIFTTRPTWQTGTIGGVAFPTIGAGFRLLPDVSMTASPANAPFAYCTSDTTAWNTGQAASCNSGLRDSSTGDLTIAGGTSFDAPIFSGLVAIINQARNSTGQGVINSTLYTLAASSAYSTIFHDITSGGNQCLAGTLYCSSTGTSEYAATTGYDPASGLGSFDFDKLLTAWPTTTSSALVETSTTLVAATNAPAASATDTITITVQEINQPPAIAIPTGSVSVVVDGGTPTSVPLVSGVATYTFSSANAGSHIIVATYSGDTLNAASTGTIGLTVSGGASFTMSAPNVSVAIGASVNDMLTITPTDGYTGTIDISYTSPDNSCLAGNEPTVTGTAAVTETFTIYTSASACNQLDSAISSPANPNQRHIRFHRVGSSHVAANHPASPWKRLPIPTALAGVILLACFRRRSKLLRASVALGIALLLSFSGLGLTGCSNNNSSTSTAEDVPAGTYTISLSGTDTLNATITASTTFTLTVN